jgi:hypothetical protein
LSVDSRVSYHHGSGLDPTNTLDDRTALARFLQSSQRLLDGNLPAISCTHGGLDLGPESCAQSAQMYPLLSRSLSPRVTLSVQALPSRNPNSDEKSQDRADSLSPSKEARTR